MTDDNELKAEVVPVEVMPDDLEAEEEVVLTDNLDSPPQPKWRINTLQEADKALSRIRYAEGMLKQLEAVYEAEEARLAERKKKAFARYEGIIRHYTFPLEDFALRFMGNRKKDRREVLPNGTLSLRTQQPEYNWGDKEALAKLLKENGYADLVQEKSEPRIMELKGRIVYQDGEWALLNDDGEKTALPITITDRGPKVNIKTED